MQLFPLETDLRTAARLARNVVRQRLGHNTPLFASYFVTNRCNVRCDGCVYYDNLDPHLARPELDTARAIRVIEALAEGGVAVVLFAGGEPMLRDDLPELLAAGHRAGLTLSVFMNGMVVTDAMIEAVDRHCAWVLFSPHVPTELGGKRADEHYRRAWEGFERVCASVRRAEAVCTLNVNKHTAPHIEDILERALHAGAAGVKFQPNWFPAMFPGAQAAAEAVRVMCAWKRKHPRFVRGDPGYLETFADFFGDTPRVACTLDRRFHIGVQADGTVSGCCPVWAPIGNLLEQPLSAMLGSRLESRADCFGCHRLDVHVALRFAGARA